MSNYEVWVLVDEQGKPVLDFNGNLAKVSSEKFEAVVVDGFSPNNLYGDKMCWAVRRFTLSELKFTDWC
jgi:hypothetical protein